MGIILDLSANPGDIRELTPTYDYYTVRTFDMVGDSTDHTILRSVIPGTGCILDFTDIGDQVTDYVDLKDITVINGKLRVRNGIDGGNNYNVIFIPKTNFESILNDQETAIETLIKTMTIWNGYNFDWTTVNNRNYALGAWPRAEVYIIEEENLDDVNGISSMDYTNRVVYEIHVAGKLTTSSNNPFFDINSIHNYAIDDLKRLFGDPDNRSVSDTCDSFLYKGFKRELKSVDQFTPNKIVTKWVATYSQDRQNPTRYAGS